MKKSSKIFIATMIAIISSLFIFKPAFANRLNKNSGQAIPILMYHSITENDKGLFKVNKNDFYEQMKYLKDNGFNTLSMDEVYDHLQNHKPFPDRSIAITFDDGYKDNYENAYPILKDLGFKATIFVVTDNLNTGSYYLSSDELIEMDADNIDIQSHTTNHPKLDKLTDRERVEALRDSKEYIEKLLNKNVKYMAYPYGRYNEKVIKDTINTGYKMALTTKQGWSSGDDLHRLKRVITIGHMRINHFKRMVNK
ncbi:polysaccharide deacetylase family protein [Clostridium sp. MSJ-4]|uniref:Polysaccharide deacetylase family protein n=1 Tax=Clostridium simiarum TaxID=2841506 RepID=A0ABS6EZ14_9CLOT|nr:polysaccharide deacetylase family protein [Clostridium simiarum]MBU5591465.1 polysaccharide deacetylase family protein [Clostridium simiarum]